MKFLSGPWLFAMGGFCLTWALCLFDALKLRRQGKTSAIGKAALKVGGRAYGALLWLIFSLLTGGIFYFIGLYLEK